MDNVQVKDQVTSVHVTLDIQGTTVKQVSY